MQALGSLLMVALVLYGSGYAAGYLFMAPTPPRMDTLVTPAKPHDVAPPALVYTAADLHAMRTQGGALGNFLAGMYWRGVIDTADMLAAAERAGGYRGQCCARMGPLAYVSMRAFVRDGLTPAADELADAITGSTSGRDHAACAIAVGMGFRKVVDVRLALAGIQDRVLSGEPPRRISIGDPLPARRRVEQVAGCGE